MIIPTLRVVPSFRRQEDQDELVNVLEVEYGSLHGFIEPGYTYAGLVEAWTTYSKKVRATDMTETSTPAPNRNKAQIGLSAADVKSLCDAAEVAWGKAGPSARRGVFTWRKRRYQSRLTNFRMLVDTLDGLPVAEKWF